MSRRIFALVILFCAVAAHGQESSIEKIDLKYSFGPKPVPGFVRVQPAEAYNVNRGYGFDLGSKVALIDRAVEDPAKPGT
jgi:hypothetical protein